MRPAVRSIAPDRVAIYIRWSTEDQAEGTTLDVQLEGCSHFVRSQGWEVTEDLVYIDDGHSGGTLDRPALSRLRLAIREGRVDCVVVFKIDRLSRNVVDTVNLVLREWENRCYLKSAREPIDTIDPAGKMFFYTLVSFAEWERNTIRDRTFSGRLRRAQQGRNPGRKLPYGYAVGQQRGEVAVVHHQAEVVRRIFREYINGASARGIAAKLNHEGVPGPAGGAWSFPTVSRLLAQEAYTGKLIWGAVTRQPRDRPAGTPVVIRNDRPLVEVEGALPAILAQEEFALAQAVRRGRPAPARGESGGRALASSYLLSGFMLCGVCGGTMRVRPPYDRKQALYFCQMRFHQGKAVCNTSHIRQQDLDAIVVAELKRRYGQPEQRSGYIEEYLRAKQGEAQGVLVTLEQVREQLRQLAGEQAHVRKHFRQSRLTIEEYRQMTDDLERESRELKEREQALATRLQDLKATVGGQEYLLEAARKVDHWDRLSPQEQKSVLRFFIAQVRAYKRPGEAAVTCEITWKTQESDR